jgi:signal peptidase I
MENSIQPGDRLLVAPGHDVRRGDVVVLERAGTSFVRRVIGLPGDRVTCCDAAGHVTVGGKPLDESYLHPGDKPSASSFSVTLGDGQLWVLGDHRSIAIDSRTWGPVPVADVVGQVAAVVHGGAGRVLRTPQTFVTSGLAPADHRTPTPVLAFALILLAALALLVLIILGTVRTLIRRGRNRTRPAGLTGVR